MSTPHMDLGTLADYWIGDVPAAEESELEEHLFACEQCSLRLEKAAILAEGIRTLTRQGFVHAVVNTDLLKRAASEGLRIREYRVPPGGSVSCTIADEDDLMVARISGDLSGVRRADVAVLREDGTEEYRFRDIPLVAGQDEVITLERTDWLRSLGVSTHRLRLIAIEEAGERIIGDYTFNHTPTQGSRRPAR